MSIVLQEAGQFIESEEKIYFAHNFALYFYKVPNVGEKITNSFHYISEEEYADCKIGNMREFMLYDATPSLVDTAYNMETTNVILPPEAVDDCIEKFHTMFFDAIKSAQALEKMVSDPEKLKSITEEELTNIIN